VAGFNRVQLIGYLGGDPEVRRLNSGALVVNLRVARPESSSGGHA
jgi:single-strand DNA-binding protein